MGTYDGVVALGAFEFDDDRARGRSSSGVPSVLVAFNCVILNKKETPKLTHTEEQDLYK